VKNLDTNVKSRQPPKERCAGQNVSNLALRGRGNANLEKNPHAVTLTPKPRKSAKN